VILTGSSFTTSDDTTAMLLDPNQHAHQIYGTQGEACYVIRPDGYIGCRHRTADARPLLQYFERIFRAISTDILHFHARVLVIQAARGCSRAATLIPDTVLRID
jgi:hypothetical protein